MALQTALVDRAYRLRKEAAPRKVEGTTVYQPSESSPIRARLTLNQAGERTEDGRVLTEPQPTLICYKCDAEGNNIDWKSSDRVLVESIELGTATYQIDGEPQPMRKKRKIIGWSLRLKRTDEQENPSQWQVAGF